MTIKDPNYTFNVITESGILWANVATGPETIIIYASDLDNRISEHSFNCLSWDFARPIGILCLEDMYLNCYFDDVLTYKKNISLLRPQELQFYYKGDDDYPEGYTAAMVIKNISFDLNDRVARQAPDKCCCGAEATYGRDTNLHTDWCEKYVK